jgi:hypothetical protein
VQSTCFMRKVKFIAAGVLVMALALIYGCNSSDSKGVNLKFNLQKGKAYQYVMDQDMQQEMSGQKMSSKMNFAYSLEVTDDVGGVKTLKTTYDRIAMSMSSPNGDINIDTDHPSADTASLANPMQMMGGMFNALKGKSFIMKVDAEGNITEVSGLNELVQSMVANMPVEEKMKPMMLQMFSAQFNEESMKQSFANAFNIFPGKPVKVGDTWEKKNAMKGMANMDMNTTYTVRDIKGDTVTLDSRSKLNSANISGEQTGTYRIDAGTGLVTEGTFEQKFGEPANMISKGKIAGREK